MDKLTELYAQVRKLADEAAAIPPVHPAVEFHTGRRAAFLTVLHVLVDDFGVMPLRETTDGSQD